MSMVRKIQFLYLGLVGCLVVPQLAAAQLSGNTYEIRSYTIGELNAANQAGAQYQLPNQVTPFTIDAPEADADNDTSYIGRRFEREEGATTTPYLPPGTMPLVPLWPSVPAVTPGTAVPATTSEPTAEPVNPADVATTDSRLAASDLCVTPRYAAFSEQAAQDRSVVQQFSVLGTAADIFLTVQAATFIIPEGYTKDEPYTVCLRVAAQALRDLQVPHDSYAVQLVDDWVYTIAAIDSEGQSLAYWQKPVQLTIKPADTLDYSLQTEVYWYDLAIAGWQAFGARSIGSDVLAVPIQNPTLLAVWTGDSLPAQLRTQQPKPASVPATAVDCSCSVKTLTGTWAFSLPEPFTWQCCLICYWRIMVVIAIVSMVGIGGYVWYHRRR